jgi:hypothetical protein
VYARLKDGVTLDQAQAEMVALAARMRTAHPGDFGGDIIVAPLNAYLFANHERLFVLLLVAVGLVLVIASANVTNLFCLPERWNAITSSPYAPPLEPHGPSSCAKCWSRA